MKPRKEKSHNGLYHLICQVLEEKNNEIKKLNELCKLLTSIRNDVKEPKCNHQK